MKIFDCLDDKASVCGHHFLEASAGTGKTFAIEQVVKRLLLKENGPKINEILLVTFTRAATRELKERIRSTIQRSLRDLKECEPLEEALCSFDRAEIYTIHSFCFRMLLEGAFDAKIAMNLQDPDELGYEIIGDVEIEDYFRGRISSDRYSKCQLDALFRLYRNDFSRLKKKLLSSALSKEEFPKYPTFSETVSAFHTLLGEFSKVSQEDFLRDFEKLAMLYKGVCSVEKKPHQKWQLQARILGNALEKGSFSDEDIELLLDEGKLFLELFSDANKKIKERDKEPPILLFPPILSRFREEFLSIYEIAQNPQHTLSRLAAELRPHLFDRFAKNGTYPPDSILQDLYAHLSNPLFLRMIRKKYKAVIIDEFQDTDPIQWKIFDRIFMEGNVDTFYLVGDPKQSIYSFRSADLYTYLAARDKMGEASRFCLDTNFRSTKSLVEKLNALFTAEKWLSLPKKETYLDVLPSKVGSEIALEFSDKKEAVHFVMASGNKGRLRTWPSIQLEEESIFPYVIGEICSLVEKGEASFKDFALLIKDRFQSARLVRLLARAGIPSQAKGVDPLSETLAFDLLENFLKATLNPHDVCSVKKMLGNPLVDFSCEELLNESSPKMEKAFLRFFHFHEIYKNEGLSALFSALYSSEFHLENISFLERLLTEKRLSDYLDLSQLMELFLSWQAHFSASRSDLLKLFSEMREKEPEEFKRRSSGESDAVTVMTTHMSKGLEFPIVFALGMASRHQGEKDTSIALKEKDAEKLRLLYVALTRAKKRVYVPYVFDADQTAVSSGTASPIECFFSTQLHKSPETLELTDVGMHLERLGISYEEVVPMDIATIQIEKKIPLLPPNEPVLNYHTRFIYSFSSLRKADEEEKKETVEALLPAGPEVGTLFHSILEKMLRSKQNISSLLEKELFGSPLEGFQQEVKGIIENAFNAPLQANGETFTLSEISSDALFPEVEFLFPYKKGEYIKGFIDLIVLHKGVSYVLDWKSNLLSGYLAHDLEQEMRRGDYFSQAEIYAHAVKGFLKDRPFGGAFYLFLRGLDVSGRGVYHYLPKGVLK